MEGFLTHKCWQLGLDLCRSKRNRLLYVSGQPFTEKGGVEPKADKQNKNKKKWKKKHHAIWGTGEFS